MAQISRHHGMEEAEKAARHFRARQRQLSDKESKVSPGTPPLRPPITKDQP